MAKPYSIDLRERVVSAVEEDDRFAGQDDASLQAIIEWNERIS